MHASPVIQSNMQGKIPLRRCDWADHRQSCHPVERIIREHKSGPLLLDLVPALWIEIQKDDVAGMWIALHSKRSFPASSPVSLSWHLQSPL